jgi:uncharacterized phage protein gp47/JayE
MPNSFDGNGLQTLTQNEIVADLTQKFQDIYGEDINVESNSPDGQLINIFAQMLEDYYELLSQVYTSFDPDQAIGTVLDQRCAINGVQRKAGTYTYVNIDVVTDRSVTLAGLDTNAVEDAYTISDSEGNQFALAVTSDLLAGTSSLRFRAVNIGNVEVLPNTITTPVTIILGVLSVNNPSGAAEQGIDEETDAELRERRKRSVSIANQGYTDGLQAALENLPDVTKAAVWQNRGSSTDADGIPGHSIWVIVKGGSDAEIGQVMNYKVAAGVGMKGTQSVNVTQSDGSVATYYFDRPSAETLYVKLDITPLDGQVIIYDDIKEQVSSMNFEPYETVDSSAIICYIKSIQANVALTCQVSTDGTTWETVVTPTTKDKYFEITPESITIVGEES